jgi:hypothetical protein
LNTLISKINNKKQATTFTKKSGKSGRRSKTSTIGREMKTSIFYSLTRPPKETQVRLGEEESSKAQQVTRNSALPGELEHNLTT